MILTTDIRAILFDYGGVLVDLDAERCFRAFDALGIDVRPYIGTYGQGGPFAPFELGHVDQATFCTNLRTLSGKTQVSDAQIAAAWQAFTIGIPTRRLRAIQAAQQQYDTLLLSNTNSLHWEQACRDFFVTDGRQMQDYFSHIFLSYVLHLEKPHAPIFEAVLRQTGYAPHEILFIDDSLTNCQGAAALGIQTFHAATPESWCTLFTTDTTHAL